jgi:hypothetical protein
MSGFYTDGQILQSPENLKMFYFFLNNWGLDKIKFFLQVH